MHYLRTTPTLHRKTSTKNQRPCIHPHADHEYPPTTPRRDHGTGLPTPRAELLLAVQADFTDSSPTTDLPTQTRSRQSPFPTRPKGRRTHQKTQSTAHAYASRQNPTHIHRRNCHCGRDHQKPGTPPHLQAPTAHHDGVNICPHHHFW